MIAGSELQGPLRGPAFPLEMGIVKNVEIVLDAGCYLNRLDPMIFVSSRRTPGLECFLRSLVKYVLIGVVAAVGQWFGNDRQATADDSDFARQIAPIFARHCLECHNSTSLDGGLDLSTREALFGTEQQTIVAGDAEASLLWQRVVADEMPPIHPLGKDEKALLRRWLEAGANWTGGNIDRFQYSSDVRAGYDWWSLQPLVDQVSIPDAGPSGTHPIDRFVDQKLFEFGLKPTGRADPRTLVRRIHNDLIGLPPRYEDVQKFIANPSEEAWSAMVDRLLASPEFGERWTQHWLDIARFGESDGFEYNQVRDHAWHYRDWVIQSLNEDMPYDRFAQMQLAGDLLTNQSPAGIAAVGFLVAGVHNPVIGQSEAMRANARHAELEEIAATVSQAFLGLTVHCARCHDHKYDPISSSDYYRFIAALDGVQHGHRVAQPTDALAESAVAKRRAELRLALTERQSQRGAIFSHSGNALVSRKTFAINSLGKKYRFEVSVSPTVWANAAQATQSSDGILIRMFREDGTVAHRFVAQPGAWEESSDPAAFRELKFEYLGDGRGDLKIRLESLTHEDRFGGALDQLTVRNAAGLSLITESFNELTDRQNMGVQFQTAAAVYFGLKSSAWDHFGINAIHAVEVSPGNLAVQIFGGARDADVELVSTLEEELQIELEALPAPQVGPTIYSVVPGAPSAMRVMRRGDPMQPQEAVAPGAPRAISSLSSPATLSETSSDAERRLDLARWMTDRKNGPFHRTMVNRVWHLLFGRGLVSTPSDLGFQGGKPTHPELLEWLTIDFRAGNLSTKSLIRRIVMSETYRRSSQSDEANRVRGEAIDRESIWLWRRNPVRLQAEVIRDSMLFTSGALSSQRLGPGYRDIAIETVGAAHYYRPLDLHGPEFDRRTIYRWRPRGERNSLLEAFDCPDPSTATPERATTTTPIQALSLWNHSFVFRNSRQLAARIILTTGEDVANQVELAWQLVLFRDPTSTERDDGIELVSKFGLPSLCRVLFNASETLTID